MPPKRTSHGKTVRKSSTGHKARSPVKRSTKRTGSSKPSSARASTARSKRPASDTRRRTSTSKVIARARRRRTSSSKRTPTRFHQGAAERKKCEHEVEKLDKEIQDLHTKIGLYQVKQHGKMGFANASAESIGQTQQIIQGQIESSSKRKQALEARKSLLQEQLKRAQNLQDELERKQAQIKVHKDIIIKGLEKQLQDAKKLSEKPSEAGWRALTASSIALNTALQTGLDTVASATLGWYGTLAASLTTSLGVKWGAMKVSDIQAFISRARRDLATFRAQQKQLEQDEALLKRTLNDEQVARDDAHIQQLRDVQNQIDTETVTVQQLQKQVNDLSEALRVCQGQAQR